MDKDISLNLDIKYVKRNTFKKIVNSCLTPRSWEFPLSRKKKITLGMSIEKFTLYLAENKNKWSNRFLFALIMKLSRLFFFPTMLDVVIWKLSSDDEGVKTPCDFYELDQRSLEYIDTITEYLPKKYKLLDLGCNCGRHLDALYRQGYHHLSGVDISQNALNKMSEWFPQVYNNTELHLSTFQRFLIQAEDQCYDAIISFGATLEVVSPTFNIIRHMARICRHYVIVNINEHSQTYPRFWEKEFLSNHFECILKKSYYHSTAGIISTFVFKRLQ